MSEKTRRSSNVRPERSSSPSGPRYYDLAKMPTLGYGAHPDVVCSWEVERMLAANGPTGGQLLRSDGQVPHAVAIIQSAGSLEADHVPYCSEICCQSAFKYIHKVGLATPGTQFVAFYKTIVAAGKEAFTAYQRALASPNVRWVQYRRVAELEVRAGAAGPGGGGQRRTAPRQIGSWSSATSSPTAPKSSCRWTWWSSWHRSCRPGAPATWPRSWASA